MRRLFLCTAVLSWVSLHSIICPPDCTDLTPEECDLAEQECLIEEETDALDTAEDEDIVDDDEVLEDCAIDDWCDDISTDYVPIGADGPISSPETPSIIDGDGIYSNQVQPNMADVEEHGVDAVTIR